jgi:hypothetical protein
VPRGGRRRLLASALLSALLGVRLARADTEPIRIEYHAPSDCPGADAFNADVFRRTTSARLVTSGEQVRTFVVVLEQRRGFVTGSLRVREGGSETVAREVQGERCQEVASALALATALAIDPNAAQSAATTPTKEESGGANTNARASDARASDAQGPSSASSQKPAGSTDASSSPITQDPDAGSGATGGARSRRLALTLGPSLLTGVTPRVALGGSLSLSSDASSAGAFPSSLALELTYLRGLRSETQGAHSAFQLIYARPAACVPGLGSGETLWLIPCLGFDIGAISGWGSDIDHERSETRVWAALDVLLRLRIALSGGWFAQAEGGVVVPLTRYDFVFLDPETSIHSVPSAAFSAGLRVGIPLTH